MARRKLNPFTADEASDNFTPSVKTIKGGDVNTSDEKPGKNKKTGNGSRKSKAEPKKAKSPGPDKKSAAKIPAKVTPEASDKSNNKPLPARVKVEDKPEKPAPSAAPVSKKDTEPERKKLVKPEKTKPKPKEQTQEEQDIIFELVGFMLGDEEFGININNVHEINRMVDITPVPRAPHFVVGVINLRGKVIPVLSLRKRLVIEEKESDNKTRIVVVEVKGTVVGFIVDEVSEVLRIPAKSVEPAPDLIAGIHSEYIKGVAKLESRLMILLDLEKILSKDQVEQIKESSS